VPGGNYDAGHFLLLLAAGGPAAPQDLVVDEIYHIPPEL
jgi:hypothetical protein